MGDDKELANNYLALAYCIVSGANPDESMARFGIEPSHREDYLFKSDGFSEQESKCLRLYAEGLRPNEILEEVNTATSTCYKVRRQNLPLINRLLEKNGKGVRWVKSGSKYYLIKVED